MELVIGEARFTGARPVETALSGDGSRVLRGADVVINTGTRPWLPSFPDAGHATGGKTCACPQRRVSTSTPTVASSPSRIQLSAVNRCTW
jgi:pyruvate/2-oxoglutarate dehydrogenase complex dihydrolipoamide dehydrogenase (E3) component